MNAKNFHKQKKDEITISPMTKAPIPSENKQEAQGATVAHLSTMNARKILELIIK